MSMNINRAASRPKRVAMIVANPTVASTTGWPVGFWASELTHAYHEFKLSGYEVVVFSPDGGRVEFDALSDPRDESGYSADDIVSMGFIHTPSLMQLLADTPAIKALSTDEFDAVVVAGGQSPMFSFPEAPELHRLLAEFYSKGKITAALCHGVCALLYVKTADGAPLIAGRTMTGFANSEEDFADQAVGQKVMPFRIEDEAKKLGANFVTAPAFRPFAVRDGRLITGQQQYSGAATARLVVEALGA